MPMVRDSAADTMSTKPVTYRFPVELIEEIKRVTKKLDDRQRFGTVTMTEVVIDALDRGLPLVEADERPQENGDDE